MLKCPNCGGGLVYDIRKKKLKCLHCDTLTEVEEYRENNSADETYDDGMMVYTCRSCGAQLISPDQAATAFCSYCGSEQIMESKLDRYRRPGQIIPFKITKKQCRNAYEQEVRKSLYAPKEFRDPKFLDTFRGIYIPYWRYDVGFKNDTISLKGKSSQRDGDYIIEKDYDLTADLSGSYDGVLYDASSSFDDTIAEAIAPYHSKEIKDYHTGYLAGFYADAIDIKDDVYKEEALEKAEENAVESLKKAFQKSRNIEPVIPDRKEKRKELLGLQLNESKSVLFPVWFLTWRKNERVAYAVVNGETGRICGDLPVDFRRFFLITSLCAVIIFLIMTALVSMTAPTALLISACAALAASYFYRREIRKIHDHENHVFDRGYFVDGRDTELSAEQAEKIRMKREQEENRAALLLAFGILGILFGLIFIIAFVEVLAEEMPADRALILCSILMIPAFLNLIRTLPFRIHLKDHSLIPEALLCFAAVAAAWFILYIQPVDDYIYYLGSLFSLSCVLITCIGLIRKYNLLATRSLPVYFERNGGDQSEAA
ncbi:MAG: hypothetical protein J6S26_05515 [Solobacterium sp.]|nr:hypothetical protein [Solobacterium sp.]